MANVTIVPPSPQVQTVSPAGGGQAHNTATLNLPPGSIVSGTIIGKDAGGNFLLNTAKGIISLQSTTPLTYNSDVVVQLGASGTSGTNARIISVNGESFADFAAPEPQTSDTISQALQSQATAAPAPSAATAAIRAIIVSAPAAEQAISNTQTGNDNSQPVIGTNVLIRLVSAPQTTVQQATVTPPPQPTASSASQTGSSSVQAHTQVQELVEDTTPTNVAKLVAPQPASLQQNSPTPVAAAPQTPEEELANSLPASPQETSSAPASTLYATYAKQAVDLPASSAAPSLSTTSTTSPSVSTSTASSAATPLPANTVPGQVVATNTDASTVTLQTPLGNITVKADAASTPQLLLPGTNVNIELPTGSALLSILTSSPLSQALLSSTPAPISELAASWQTLTDILDVVGENNPPAATTLLARLPQLGANFVTSSAAFIGALAEGNARKLLGDDAINTLQQNGRSDLVQKLSGEMNELSSAYMQPAPKETTSWQPLFLPFVYQEELQQARLYIKREPPKKGAKNSASTHDTRFVVEVDLSELGPMQMDGLVRDKQQTTAFDLIIRSRHAFSPADQQGISEIYVNASELTGFKGSITFQVTQNFPVKPLEEILIDKSRSITA